MPFIKKQNNVERMKIPMLKTAITSLTIAAIFGVFLYYHEDNSNKPLIDYKNFTKVDVLNLPKMENDIFVVGWRHKKLTLNWGDEIPCTKNIPKWMDIDSDDFMLKATNGKWWYNNKYSNVYNAKETIKFIKSCVPVYNDYMQKHGREVMR